jgi:hypothetical protein
LYKKLALSIDLQNKKLSQETSHYGEMHPLLSGFYFYFHWERSREWVRTCSRLRHDSFRLEYCWSTQLGSPLSQLDLYILTHRYLPEYFPYVEKKLDLDFSQFLQKGTQEDVGNPADFSFSGVPRDKNTRRFDIHTCREGEEYLHHFVFFKKFFVFLF